jgi:hypothetical protein
MRNGVCIDRAGTFARPLRAAIAAEARRGFEDLCGSLFLLTAAVSRARRSGACESELEAIETHAEKAIATARGLGEFVRTRTSFDCVSVSAVARDLTTLLEALPTPRPKVTLRPSLAPDLVCLPRARVEFDLIAALDEAMGTTEGTGPIEIAVEASGDDDVVVRVRTPSGKMVEVSFEAAG